MLFFSDFIGLWRTLLPIYCIDPPRTLSPFPLEAYPSCCLAWLLHHDTFLMLLDFLSFGCWPGTFRTLFFLLGTVCWHTPHRDVSMSFPAVISWTSLHMVFYSLGLLFVQIFYYRSSALAPVPVGTGCSREPATRYIDSCRPHLNMDTILSFVDSILLVQNVFQLFDPPVLLRLPHIIALSLCCLYYKTIMLRPGYTCVDMLSTRTYSRTHSVLQLLF